MSTRRQAPVVDDLRSLPLFTALSEEQLDWLSANGASRVIEPGWVYQKGQPAESLFVLLEGEVEMRRGTDAELIDVVRTSQRGTYGGAVLAYLGVSPLGSYTDSMRAVTSGSFFILPAEAFANLLERWFPMAVLLLRGQFDAVLERRDVRSQREQMHSFESLAADLTHELNNPAAAAVRATSLLRNRVWRSQEKLTALAQGKYTGEQLAALLRVQEDALRRTAQARQLDPIEAADRYDELVRWFEAYELHDGWDLAPTFVQADLDIDFFDRVMRRVGIQHVEDAVRWLSYAVESELLMREIEELTRRISAVVASATHDRSNA